MTPFNHVQMQSALTPFGLGPLSFWEVLAVLGGCFLVAVAVAACLPRRQRLVNPRHFSRLLDRVHHCKERPFIGRPAPPWRGAAREQFLESVRERLRACDIFHRDTDDVKTR